MRDVFLWTVATLKALGQDVFLWTVATLKALAVPVYITSSRQSHTLLRVL